MITMIWAQTKDGVIGLNGDMPWHCPEDLAHFKKTTAEHVIVMGRKTWDSLPRKPLPGREHVVLTRTDLGVNSEKVITYDNLIDLISWLLANKDRDIMIIGGGTLYKALMPYANKLVVTQLDFDTLGDTHAPIIDLKDWRKLETKSLGSTSHVIEYWERY